MFYNKHHTVLFGYLDLKCVKCNKYMLYILTQDPICCAKGVQDTKKLSSQFQCIPLLRR